MFKKTSLLKIMADDVDEKIVDEKTDIVDEKIIDTVVEKKTSNGEKWLISVICGLLFLLMASPFLFTFVNDLFQKTGLTFATPSGCPTDLGLVFHAVVFIFIIRLIMW